MAASEASAANLGGHDSPAPQQRTELDVAWRQFGSAGSPEDFCRSWLALQCHAIGEVRDAVVVLQKPGTEAFGPLAFWPEGQRDRSALVEIAERALREAGGGGTMLLHTPAQAEAYMKQFGRDIERLAAQGWRIAYVAKWEDILEFARKFTADLWK